MSVLLFLIFGFVAGLIARMLMPASHPLSPLATMILGVAGSFVGALLASVALGYPATEFHHAGLAASVLGSIVILSFVGFAFTPRRTRFLHR